jgi:hypothetical protein
MITAGPPSGPAVNGVDIINMSDLNDGDVHFVLDTALQEFASQAHAEARDPENNEGTRNPPPLLGRDRRPAPRRDRRSSGLRR